MREGVPPSRMSSGFCHKCGVPYTTDAAFCGNCGATRPPSVPIPVTTASSPNPTQTPPPVESPPQAQPGSRPGSRRLELTVAVIVVVAAVALAYVFGVYLPSQNVVKTGGGGWALTGHSSAAGVSIGCGDCGRQV